MSGHEDSQVGSSLTFCQLSTVRAVQIVPVLTIKRVMSLLTILVLKAVYVYLQHTKTHQTTQADFGSETNLDMSKDENGKSSENEVGYN